MSAMGDRKKYTGAYRSNVYGQQDDLCDIEYHICEEGFEGLPVDKAPMASEDVSQGREIDVSKLEGAA